MSGNIEAEGARAITRDNDVALEYTKELLNLL